MRKPALPALLIAIFMLTATVLASAGQNPDPARPGYAFLERLVVLIIKAAAPAGGNPDIGPDIIGLAKELKAAQAAKQVDDVFAVRYRRLLSAVRQALLMDPEVLYWPMYRHSMIDFIEERTGRIPEWNALQRIVNDHGGAGVGPGRIADAVISEVVSLHIHLDTLDKRPEILKSYVEKGMK
jgi:hypothetical protein